MEKKLTLILDILTAIFCFIFLILACLSYSNIQFKSKYIETYKTNWNLSPIEAIFPSANSECPSGYSPLISTTFPGNTAGCDCTKSNKKVYKRKVMRNHCEEDHIVSGCALIPERNATSVPMWKGTTLCVKRMNDFTYQRHIHNSYIKTCPRNTKQCGYLDTENTPLCINTNLECPINYIDILPQNQEPLFVEGIHSITLNDGNTLYFTNSATNNPILIDVVIANNSMICSHPLEGLFGENKYLLNKRYGPSDCRSKIGNFKYDWRFSEIDTYSTNQFYIQNNIDYIINTLPNYPPLDDKQLSMNTINYFGIKGTCYNKKVNVDKLFEPKYDKVESRDYALIIIIVVDVIFVICVMIGFKTMMKYRISELIVLIINAADFLLLILIFAVSLSVMSGIGNSNKQYEEFVNNKCGDDITINAIKMSYENILKAAKYSLGVFGCCTILIALKVIYYIWFYFIRKN